ncbi:MAG: Gfo/Idh/MocA family oxidoreductase [Spirochaetales bacterium]|nr:Gfo/Idh/MocA family oxidoreductase [Spirochaetales bacterium]
MNDGIRIGIIGAGANTKLRHIPGLKKIDGVEIVAVANRSRESGQKVADEFGIGRVYDHWTELVAGADADAVVIGTWPYLHRAATVAALKAGKHVLCEARMAADSREAKEMLRVSLEHPELVAQIVPSPMTLGVDAAIQRLIGDGYLGDIVSLEVRGNPDTFVDLSRPFHWRENREYSGNNILTLGIWYEAVMRWVGPAIKVSAMGKTFIPMRGDGGIRTTDVPDHVDVTAEMACGAQMHMQLSGVTGVGGTTEAYVFGTEGTLLFASGKLYGAKRGQEKLSEISIAENEIGGWRVEEEFIGAIRGKEKVKLTDFAAGVRYMEFVDGVNHSIKLGKGVSLPME